MIFLSNNNGNDPDYESFFVKTWFGRDFIILDFKKKDGSFTAERLIYFDI